MIRELSSEGMVKTTWKYWMGRVSSPVLRAVLTKDIRQFDAVRHPHQSSGNYTVLFGMLSRGLVTCARFKRLTCRYTVVVVGDLWPKRSWT